MLIINNRRRSVLGGIIASNFLFDYDADLGVTTDGSGVTAWADQRGNVGDLASSTAALSPDLITNGNPNADGDAIDFNGTSESMKVAAGFTWNQPETIYLVIKQTTYTLSDQFTDGNSNGSFNILNVNVSPDFTFNAGLSVGNNSDLAVNTWGIVCIVANGASSSVRVDNNAKVSGDASTTNAGGFTLGSKSNQTENFSNIVVARILGYDTVAHTDAQQDQNITSLNNIYSVF